MAWVAGNYHLTQAEMEHNAGNVHLFFKNKGWTDNAIAGMLGNMQVESEINPGAWQEWTPPSEGVERWGYGLVQWDPYTKYSNWYGSGWENNGPAQCKRIIYELENGEQYYKTSDYPLTFREFTQSTATPEYLARAWIYNYERPTEKDQPIRETYARNWYNFIQGRGETLPAWMIILLRRGQGR